MIAKISISFVTLVFLIGIGKQIQPLGHCHSTSLSEYPTKSGLVGAGCAKPFDLPAGGPP
jgi:hypothetical protein